MDSMSSQKIVLDRKKLRPLTPHTDYFLALVRSIIYQQISGKAGDSIFGRFSLLFTNITPEAVAKLSDEDFVSAGISPQKKAYLRDLARCFLEGVILVDTIPSMSDVDIVEHLIQVKGVGVWTAQMFLMFTLARPDVLPTGDLAIRKGFMKVFGLDSVPTEQEMIALAVPYEGERTYLSLYLWQTMDEEKKKK